MTFIKDPDAVLDYKWDWAAATNGTGASDWLTDGEIITEYTVVATDGLTVDSHSLADTATSVVAWLSGGTANTSYAVTCHIETGAGRQDDRTITIKVVNR